VASSLRAISFSSCTFVAHYIYLPSARANQEGMVSGRETSTMFIAPKGPVRLAKHVGPSWEHPITKLGTCVIIRPCMIGVRGCSRSAGPVGGLFCLGLSWWDTDIIFPLFRCPLDTWKEIACIASGPHAIAGTFQSVDAVLSKLYTRAFAEVCDGFSDHRSLRYLAGSEGRASMARSNALCQASDFKRSRLDAIDRKRLLVFLPRGP